METIKVISSAPLDAETIKKIEKAFMKKHKNKVDFSYEVDFSIIGGILIIDGNNYYDATIKGQLDKIRKSM